MGPVGGVGHVSAACGASPVVSGLPPLRLLLRAEEGRKGVNRLYPRCSTVETRERECPRTDGARCLHVWLPPVSRGPTFDPTYSCTCLRSLRPRPRSLIRPSCPAPPLSGQRSPCRAAHPQARRLTRVRSIVPIASRSMHPSPPLPDRSLGATLAQIQPPPRPLPPSCATRRASRPRPRGLCK